MYKVVSGGSISELEQVVNRHIVEWGYTCQGGVTHSNGQFYQALINNEELRDRKFSKRSMWASVN